MFGRAAQECSFAPLRDFSRRLLRTRARRVGITSMRKSEEEFLAFTQAQGNDLTHNDRKRFRGLNGRCCVCTRSLG